MHAPDPLSRRHLRDLPQAHPPGAISCRYGEGRALAGPLRGDRALLSQGREQPAPVGLERMLRITFLQQWFSLSDPGAEEAPYGSASLCRFVGIALRPKPVPDETTILKVRYLLGKHHLGKKLFQKVHRHLESQGVKVSQGHDRGRHHHQCPIVHQESGQRARSGQQASDASGEPAGLRDEPS